MSEGTGFMEHWVNIEDERMERYETMFAWTPASESFYTSANIDSGQVVVDFGCGPGHAAIEFAGRVGPSGHVHAMDINAEFAAKAKNRAEQAQLSDRISVHLLADAAVPLAENSVDRVVARNTIIYVGDPAVTYAEFQRVLKPGGIAHAIEGDWSLTMVEPLATKEWRQIIDAARWAWPRPEIGRKLYGIARQAGFSEISLQIVTVPDTTGRLHSMIKTVTGYARESGRMEPRQIDSILDKIEQAMEAGTYLAISPQFLVTAIK